MKRILLALSVGFVAFGASAQNLVTDGGLEDTLKCPQTIGRFYHPTTTSEQYTAQWRSTTLASPDYHNTCGYSTYMPRNGEGYAGILYYDPSEVREYITALLSSPLVAGERYYLEYYVALSPGSTQAVDQVQIHLSNGVPLDQTWPPPGPLALTPTFQAASAPTDTNYAQIHHCYTAVGGEDAITFGNFMDNANTTLTTVSGVGAVNAYYYIDDVSIVLFDSFATQNGLTLSANMDSAQYQWVDCNNSFAPLAGETNQDYTATAAGDYAVIVTIGDCIDTSECHSIIIGIDDQETKSINIFPNPANESVQLTWTNHIQMITISDALGRTIFELNAEGISSTTIDISDFQKGSYFVNVLENNSWSTTKLLKE